MRFEHTSDQRDFAASLESLLASSDTAAVARAWAEGDADPGLKLWARLAEQGLTMLATEATPVELVIAFEALGRHGVPGPWVESAAYLPVALGREIEGIATVAVPPHVPYALDADVADHVFAVVDGQLSTATVGEAKVSVDRTRRLFEVAASSTTDAGDLEAAFDLAVLATSAQLLGAGERILADSVTYVKQRKQFGREIGSYQAIKHALADVRIALDFARPACRRCRGRGDQRLGRQGRLRRRGLPLLPHGPAGARRDRLHPGVRPEHLAHQGPGPGDRVGHAGVPPRADPGGPLMEFAFSEEQTELASTVRSLLAKRADPRLADYDQELWQTLCEQIGVAALGIPEDYDGAGFSLFESLIVLEEIGRSLVPSPLLSSLVTAEALLAGGDEDAKRRLLPRIAAGEVATVAIDVQQPVLDVDHAAIVLAVVGDDLVEIAHPETEWTESMDQTIRLGRLLDATGGSDRRRACGQTPRRAGRGSRRDRAADRPRRAGTGHDGQLQQGAGAVRPADRLVPGAQAPDGRHAGAARDVALGVLVGVVRRFDETPTTPPS